MFRLAYLVLAGLFLMEILVITAQTGQIPAIVQTLVRFLATHGRNTPENV